MRGAWSNETKYMVDFHNEKKIDGLFSQISLILISTGLWDPQATHI